MRLDLTSPRVVVGRHSVWLPDIEVKVPFQWGGRITKYQKFEQTYDLRSLLHEWAILNALAKRRMAPPVGDWVFFDEVISKHPGGWWCDPAGAVGFKMQSASRLLPGSFDIFAMQQDFPIEGSKGAWGDVLKPGNVVNGYLVDVRRSAFDMLRWKGERPEWPRTAESVEDLHAAVHRLCQFPKGERPDPYQDYWTGDVGMTRGSRSVEERAEQLRFSPEHGETVLDIGCNCGGMLQYAAIESASAGVAQFIGIDTDPDYISCAKRLARSCDMNICFRTMDCVKEGAALIHWISELWPRGPDHLLLLSMEKHIGEDHLFTLVDRINAGVTYIETNACKEGQYKLRQNVEKRRGSYVGDSTDRNLRRLYRIPRRP